MNQDNQAFQEALETQVLVCQEPFTVSMCSGAPEVFLGSVTNSRVMIGYEWFSLQVSQVSLELKAHQVQTGHRDLKVNSNHF